MLHTHTIPAPNLARRRTSRSPVATVAVVLGTAVMVLSLIVATLEWRAGRSSGGAPTTQAPPDAGLAQLEAKVQDAPDDASAWAALGAAYVDHARVNSDPSAYPAAERALERSLALESDGNWEALAGSAALAAGRHDFGTALRFSQEARELQPQSSFILGIVVDSLTELGRYAEAVDAAQVMVDVRPDIASYARVSYQRELHGDVDGAIQAMESALRASSTGGDRAFARYYLGELEWNRGALEQAAVHYEAALRADPEAAPAKAGLGKVEAANGRLDEAILLYEEAAKALPDPELLKELGELYLVTGQRALADEAFARSAAENARQAAGGVDVNLETALFSADHRHELDQGLAAAREEWDRRHSIHVADALAWQLFVHGDYEEALGYANEALELGTRSALFHFHRAEIHRALGHREEALTDYEEAMSINPSFSFLHQEAARAAITG